MITLKNILRKLLEKKGYNMAAAPDSVWSRATSNTKVIGDKEGENERQANGAEVAKKMDFDPDQHRSVHDASPMSFMDAVLQSWGITEPDEGIDDE